ncbi:invasion associated locus B family protein [Nitratireductor sp. XY-223]|uniref:invasion associated locus B family protein n=1 Tax=Nitratireductor sp. XY-223 TaxID=2561926 RepID=UPI0010AA3C64|nr:invasion associated locus B family protein [Nitratireductor sp. XY-223]
MLLRFGNGKSAGPTAALAVLIAGLAFNSSASAQNAGAPDNARNWSVVCVSAGREDALACTMEQQIIVRETGQRLARLTIKTTKAAEDGFASLLLQVPLGLSIVDGLSMQVDQAAPVAIPIQTCDANGCYGGHIVDQALLTALRAGSQLVLSFFDLQKQKIDANFTLAGFTAAYARID